MLELSQVILVTPDLDRTRARFEDLGFTVVAGGRHPGLGTAICVIPLGRQYLELLGVVDHEEAAANLFGQSVLRAAQEGEHLVRWSLRTDEIDAVAAEAKVAVEFRSRVTPSGELLSWRAAGLRVSLEKPCRPFFMQWDDSLQYPGALPVQHANGAIRIDELVVATSEPVPIEKWVGRANAPVRIIPGPCLVALVTIGGEDGTSITIPDASSSVGRPRPRLVPREVGDEVAGRIPRWSPLRALGHGVPSRGALDLERCPTCGRRVGFALGPGGGYGGGGIPRSQAELVAACLVDGPRARYARLWSPDEIVDAARVIAEALTERGWKRWGGTLREAIDQPKTGNQIEAVGLMLDALRGFGPLALPWDAPTERERAQDPRTLTEHDFNVLVASSAPHWPTAPAEWF